MTVGTAIFPDQGDEATVDSAMHLPDSPAFLKVGSILYTAMIPEKFKDQDQSAVEGYYVPLVVPIATTSLLAQSNVRQDVSSSSIRSNGSGSFTSQCPLQLCFRNRRDIRTKNWLWISVVLCFDICGIRNSVNRE